MVIMMVMLLTDRSIDIEEKHYVGHMHTEYEIGRPTTWQNPRRHHHKPLQRRYNKQLAINVMEL